MNERENAVHDQLKKEGWHVLRNGAPDFIAYKTDGNRQVVSMKAVEVKSPSDELNAEQKIYKRLLEHLGVPYEVEVVSIPGVCESNRIVTNVPEFDPFTIDDISKYLQSLLKGERITEPHKGAPSNAVFRKLIREKKMFWNWAKKWISGEDRSSSSAYEVRNYYFPHNHLYAHIMAAIWEAIRCARKEESNATIQNRSC